jgi:hypothetical protein
MPRSPCPEGQTRNRTTKACRDRRRPGRRPGKTAKSVCPEGQVRNRTTKACRPRMRPGRRPGKTAKKPSVKTARIAASFILEDYDDNNNYNINVNNNKSLEDKIVDWYTERGKELIDMGYFTYLKFKYLDLQYINWRRPIEHILEVSYIANQGEDAKVALEMLADPDSDGNYPIKEGRETLLISGRIYTDM